jgi:hypothetical protein
MDIRNSMGDFFGSLCNIWFMKNILLILLLSVAPMTGCSLMGQSNAAHHAVEDHNYNVDKVVVKVKNGKKTVVVHLLDAVDQEDTKRIKAIVREEIPDADKVRVKQP